MEVVFNLGEVLWCRNKRGLPCRLDVYKPAHLGNLEEHASALGIFEIREIDKRTMLRLANKRARTLTDLNNPEARHHLNCLTYCGAANFKFQREIALRCDAVARLEASVGDQLLELANDRVGD